MTDLMVTAAELARERELLDAGPAWTPALAPEPFDPLTPAVRVAVEPNRMELRAAVVIAAIRICNEVDRHLDAIDTRDATAVSVLAELMADQNQAMRMLANLLMPEVRS